MMVTLAELVGGVSGAGAELVGDPETEIRGLSTLDAAGPSDLTFLAHPRYLSKLVECRAACVIVSPALQDEARRRGTCIITPDPYHYFALVTQWWKKRARGHKAGGIHRSAVIDTRAQVSPHADIGPFVSIDAGAIVQAGVSIAAHCVIGARAVVGAGSRLAPRVTVGDDCRIGERCILHSGVVIGADGFGFAPHQGEWVKIEQLGAVQIGNDVEIGANSCVDRGALLDTVIEDGVKIDNLVQIGHNVRIGRHSALAGCAGVAGSAVIGANCTIGGGAIVLGHLALADHVNISAASVVMRSITKPGLYTGLFPIDDNATWEKNAASLKQLNALRERLKQLEKWMASSLEKP
jgi:UDP-3-O-[3-hydroxymyristoyl] glucosamine N-acyltransferase